MLSNCLISCTTCDEDATSPRNRTVEEKRERAQAGSTCFDEAEDCGDIALNGGCHNGSDAPLRCAYSCRACGFRKLTEEAFGCKDGHDSCKTWADAGECTKNSLCTR